MLLVQTLGCITVRSEMNAYTVLEDTGKQTFIVYLGILSLL